MIRADSVFSELVAPFTGAWIEIIKEKVKEHELWVAPFTGAWIEIGGQ